LSVYAERKSKNRKIFYPNTRNVLQSKYCFDDIKKAREELVRNEEIIIADKIA